MGKTGLLDCPRRDKIKIKSAMVPVVKRYDMLDEEARYQFRRKVRSPIKWYSYVTQIVRMFDREMHKEYVFLGYLVLLSARQHLGGQS